MLLSSGWRLCLDVNAAAADMMAPGGASGLYRDDRMPGALAPHEYELDPMTLFNRFLLIAAAATLLAACSSSPKNITLATPDSSGAKPTAAQSGGQSDIATQAIRYVRTRPGCSGDTCPSIEVDSIAVPEVPKLSELIDHVLAFMTGLDPARTPAHQTLVDYELYFFQTAQARDTSIFTAKIRDTYNGLITVELHTNQHVTGSAHGVPATQFLNWQRARQRVLALNEAIEPGQQAAFLAAALAAHGRWKAQQEDYRRDPATFDRMWPFQETDNFALTQNGLVLKYDAYEIAPYAAGQPEILLPYGELNGVLAPVWLPRSP